MSRSPTERVVSHWHKLIEGLQTSSLGFYDDLEKALASRNIFGLSVRRIRWAEGGVLSPNREYLRVEGGQHCVDICAAPFGTGFFFSAWVTRRQVRFLILYLLAIALVLLGLDWLLMRVWLAFWGSSASWVGPDIVIISLSYVFRYANPLTLLPLAMLVTLFLIGLTARAGVFGFEGAVVVVPVMGWLYERLFAPVTYYRLDTMLMFRAAVHATMLETIDQLTTSKGVRALSEDERAPVLLRLM